MFLVLPGERALPTFTLAFVGDVMLGRGVAQALDGEWEAAFSDVKPWLAGADVAFANLESPLIRASSHPSPEPPVREGEGGVRYDLQAPVEAVVALRGASFDIVSLANNHALDGGTAGLAQTLDVLRAAGIVGVVDWAMRGAVDGGQFPRYRSTGIPTVHVLAFDDSAGRMDVKGAVRAVAAAAEQVDLVIVSVHWGGEYQAAPSPRQEAVARALAEAGADVLVGHGPHVLQRVDRVGEAVVAYSLGNFLFDQPYPADCRWGAILRVAVRGTRVVAVWAVPTLSEGGRVRLADPEDASAILARLALDRVLSSPYPASSIQHLASGIQHLASVVHPTSRSNNRESSTSAHPRHSSRSDRVPACQQFGPPGARALAP
jgi:poly-gamma-glutamate synthesis protein (capsule biosynthesis protein)